MGKMKDDLTKAEYVSLVKACAELPLEKLRKKQETLRTKGGPEYMSDVYADAVAYQSSGRMIFVDLRRFKE